MDIIVISEILTYPLDPFQAFLVRSFLWGVSLLSIYWFGCLNLGHDPVKILKDLMERLSNGE